MVRPRQRRGLRRLDDKGRQRLLATLVDEIRVLPGRGLEIHGILPARTVDMELRQPASTSEQYEAVGYVLTVPGVERGRRPT